MFKQRRSSRTKIKSTSDRLRLSVFRSNTNIYAQIINDESGKTMVSASSLQLNSGNQISKAMEVGTLIGVRALENGITNVIFDRGNRVYSGRLKALANAAREAGLKF